jgi:hypothetical protein
MYRTFVKAAGGEPLRAAAVSAGPPFAILIHCLPAEGGQKGWAILCFALCRYTSFHSGKSRLYRLGSGVMNRWVA